MRRLQPSNFYLLQRQGDFPKFVQSLVRHYTSEKIKRIPSRGVAQASGGEEEGQAALLHRLLAAVLAFTLCSKVSLALARLTSTTTLRARHKARSLTTTTTRRCSSRGDGVRGGQMLRQSSM